MPAALRRLPVTVSLSLLLLPALRAQLVEFKGGDSSLFHVSGATVSYEDPRYKAWAGFGWSDGPVEGFLLTAPFRGGYADLGDQTIPFVLPTDVFNSSLYFLGRGAAFRRQSKSSSFLFFGGYTSDRFGAPFLVIASPQRPVSALFFDHALPGSLRYSAHIVASQHLTWLQSLEWKPEERFALAGTAGASGSDPYVAGSLDLRRTWVELQASYVDTRPGFRRIFESSPLNAEYDKENVALTLHPWRSFSFSLTRENLLAPNQEGGDSLRARVQGGSFSGTWAGVRFHGAIFDSSSASYVSRAYSAGGERRIFPRVTLNVDYFRVAPRTSHAATNVSAGLRERINAHWRLNQAVQLGGSQKSLALGGEFTSHRFTAGIDYQTVYVPFYIPGQSQFRQVGLIHFSWLLPHDLQLHVDTNVTPTGSVRYTAWADGQVYADGVAADAPPAAFKPNGCMVRGRVLTTERQAVAGAALAVNGQLTYSDSDGAFLVRFRKCADYPLRVLFNEFLVLDPFAVVSAPSQVTAAPEEHAAEILVVLRRLPPPEPPPPTKPAGRAPF